MPPRRSARAAGTRLFAVYAVASLVPVVALGAVLGQSMRRDAADRALEWGRTQAAVVEEMVIAPALHGTDLSMGITATERARLETATDLAIFRGSVERLRLRDFDGAILFADDGNLSASPIVRTLGDAPVPSDSPAFQAAAHGETEATILHGETAPRAVRVLRPVVGDTSGRSLGVLEIVLPYAAVAAEVEAATEATYWRLGAGLSVLWLALAAISWSTSRRLRRHAARSAHAALHDSLTGLPNRAYFREQVEEALGRPGGCAVALVDLDRFKEVNDTLGHHAGDQMLHEVGRRLVASLRSGDTVARLGGDEFGLLLPGMADRESARHLLERVSDELSAELVLDGVPLAVEASVGIALHPADGDDVEQLLTRADAAMYKGKRGTAAVVVFDEACASAPTHHLSIQHDIRHAIEAGELRLDYQPQVELRTGRTASAEALVRWQHPTRGLLEPGEFLPAVEHSTVMAALTDWVIRRALADCASWRACGLDWGVAVNVSARNLHEIGFADTVARLAAEAGVPPSSVQFEVTETALPVDPDAVAATLAALTASGFGTALDDFGVGYASLSHLRLLSLTEVKIDRGFVSGIVDSPEDREVVSALIRLAHGLGLTVCAEGVETSAAAEWLRRVGCDRAQGFLISRALPWRDVLLQPCPTPSVPAVAPALLRRVLS